MTENLPDYAAIEVPDDKPKAEFSTHERRAAVWRVIRERGSPARANKAALARTFGVNRSTIYRDFERLREWAGDSLGEDAKLTSRAIFEKVTDELLAADDWRAKKAAFDVAMEWNEWLADLGEQHREPTKSEIDVRSRNLDVAYTIRREGDDDPLPTGAEGGGDGESVDYEALGFTSAPTSVPIEDADGETPRGDQSE